MPNLKKIVLELVLVLELDCRSGFNQGSEIGTTDSTDFTDFDEVIEDDRMNLSGKTSGCC